MPSYRSKSPRAPMRVEATRITAELLERLPVDATVGDWLVTTDDGHMVAATNAQFTHDFEKETEVHGS